MSAAAWLIFTPSMYFSEGRRRAQRQGLSRTFVSLTRTPAHFGTPLLQCPLYFAVGMEEGLDGIADMLPELPGPNGFRSQSKNRPANLSSQKEARRCSAILTGSAFLNRPNAIWPFKY